LFAAYDTPALRRLKSLRNRTENPSALILCDRRTCG
jgi:hypothetical protein